MELLQSIMHQADTIPHYEELKGRNPEACKSTKELTELFNLYEKAIEKYKNTILFYTCQQGKLLTILKKKERGNYQKVVRKSLKISMSTAKLRVRMFKLVDKYRKLLYSNLSLHYFNKNHKLIKEICHESENEFK